MSISLSSNFDLVTALPLDARFVKADTTARDAIATLQRFEGLLVYTVADTTLWQLQGGITNSDWVSVGGGGAAAVEIQWEGVTVVATVSTLNFKGTAVQGVTDQGGGVVDVNLLSGGGASEGPATFGLCDTPLNVDATGLSMANTNMSLVEESQVVFVQSSGAGNVDITANPQIEGHSLLGAEMIIVGKDDTKTVQFDDGNGLKLNGSCLLGLNDTLRLFWDGTYWVELRRSA